MKTQILMAAMAVGLTLNALPGAAQDRPALPDFATLDTDGNGSLSPQELQALASARFGLADSNGDGGLSVEEISAMMQRRGAERVARMLAERDTNGDGLLQIDEMPQPRGDRAARLFDRADTDDDGALSAAEFDAVRERMAERGGAERHGKGRSHDDRG